MIVRLRSRLRVLRPRLGLLRSLGRLSARLVKGQPWRETGPDLLMLLRLSLLDMLLLDMLLLDMRLMLLGNLGLGLMLVHHSVCKG